MKPETPGAKAASQKSGDSLAFEDLHSRETRLACEEDLAMSGANPAEAPAFSGKAALIAQDGEVLRRFQDSAVFGGEVLAGPRRLVDWPWPRESSLPKRTEIERMGLLKERASLYWKVYLAYPPGSQFEALCWRLVLSLGLASPRRVELWSLDPGDLAAAIASARSVDIGRAAKCEAGIDLARSVSWPAAKILSKWFGSPVPVGPVVSPALELIRRREEMVAGFHFGPGLGLGSDRAAVLSLSAPPSWGKGARIEAKLDPSAFCGRASSGAAALGIEELMVRSVKLDPPRKTSRFGAAELIASAEKELGFSAALTLRLAVNLYQKGLVAWPALESGDSPPKSLALPGLRLSRPEESERGGHAGPKAGSGVETPSKNGFKAAWKIGANMRSKDGAKAGTKKDRENRRNNDGKKAGSLSQSSPQGSETALYELIRSREAFERSDSPVWNVSATLSDIEGRFVFHAKFGVAGRSCPGAANDHALGRVPAQAAYDRDPALGGAPLSALNRVRAEAFEKGFPFSGDSFFGKPDRGDSGGAMPPPLAPILAPILAAPLEPFESGWSREADFSSVMGEAAARKALGEASLKRISRKGSSGDSSPASGMSSGTASGESSPKFSRKALTESLAPSSGKDRLPGAMRAAGPHGSDWASSRRFGATGASRSLGDGCAFPPSVLGAEGLREGMRLKVLEARLESPSEKASFTESSLVEEILRRSLSGPLEASLAIERLAREKLIVRRGGALKLAPAGKRLAGGLKGRLSLCDPDRAAEVAREMSLPPSGESGSSKAAIEREAALARKELRSLEAAISPREGGRDYPRRRGFASVESCQDNRHRDSRGWENHFQGGRDFYGFSQANQKRSSFSADSRPWAKCGRGSHESHFDESRGRFGGDALRGPNFSHKLRHNFTHFGKPGR